MNQVKPSVQGLVVLQEPIARLGFWNILKTEKARDYQDSFRTLGTTIIKSKLGVNIMAACIPTRSYVTTYGKFGASLLPGQICANFRPPPSTNSAEWGTYAANALLR